MKKILFTFIILTLFVSCKKVGKESNPKGPLSFKLKSIDGELINLEDYKGNYILIDFWASWCPPCKQAIPYIIKIFNDYGGNRFYVFGIGLEDENALFNYSRSQNIPYLILAGNKEIANYYKVQAIPTLVLLDPDGKIIYKHVGFSEDGMAELENKIKKSLEKLQ